MIVGMAAKTLSQVEVNSWRSNQHEFNGVSSLKRIFGTARKYFSCQLFYLSEDGMDADSYTSSLTWYDARENHPTRNEYRLYYDSYLPLTRANAGDTMIITLDDRDMVNIYIIAAGTQLADFLMSQLSRSVDTNYSIFTDPHELALIADAIENR